MAFAKIGEIRTLGDEEVAEEILAVKRELFQFRFQRATRQPIKPHIIKAAKHRLSQLLMVEHERHFAANQPTPTEENV